MTSRSVLLKTSTVLRNREQDLLYNNRIGTHETFTVCFELFLKVFCLMSLNIDGRNHGFPCTVQGQKDITPADAN